MVGHYDVLDLKHPDGTPAVMLCSDGSGFAYYPSGRKAVCISAHGADNEGKARRFSAIIHSDTQRGGVLGSFDEWGRGNADGQRNPGDASAPKVIISEKEVMVVDGSGHMTVVPRDAPSPKASRSGGPGGGTDLALRLSACVSLRYRHGRLTLDFRSDGISHSFIIGELLGELPSGMTRAQKTTAPSAVGASREILDMDKQLLDVRQRVGGLKIDPTQKGARPDRTQKGRMQMSASTSSLTDIMDSLSALQQTLSHPNLAPLNLQWKTEKKLKNMLASAHPACPAQDRVKGWTISRVSGKCTEERLLNAKPTVTTPKTVTPVSQLQLPEIIEDCSSKGVLLVVICLATFAQEPSASARLLAEKAHAELCQRFAKAADGSSPVKLVSIELTEGGNIVRQYGVKEAPFCLMFQGGKVVHSKRLSAATPATTLRDTCLAKPRILLVEANPAFQLKVEHTLRRSGYESDLAQDLNQANRLAARPLNYGVLLASARFDAAQLRTLALTVQRGNPRAVILAYDTASTHDLASQEDPDNMRRFLESCTHVFPYMPSYTTLVGLLSGNEGSKPSFKRVGHNTKDFVEEILGVMNGGTSAPGGYAKASMAPAVEAS
eukprot:TRINITY_DN28627_c0_g1_i1.p1 TRINITY_DN28627_c0_g1~~TRINITY_DN28627_c0_g1_i1.p1  ORF type:complete len:607 (+),score=144.46 TRINITY_DN28627_c0_g1_i1:102-1922(+)